ncbi:MAG TPA: hypothetical protein VNJ01_12215 [Bacteriovoracaceae bacterium]|nr:hypothetical protein [Bacteriovoracaceae bacterium]
MRKVLKTLCLGLTLSVLSSAAGAALLPEGSFMGRSSLQPLRIIDHDVMALLLRKNPKKENSYYAVLAEYDRVPGTTFSKTSALTKWVPRMAAYQVDKINDLQYAMQPLGVSFLGNIQPRNDVNPDLLTLKKANSVNGAIVTRYHRDSSVRETIKFYGNVGSTWEAYVPGTYFGSTDTTGGDYLKKGINTVLTPEGIAQFDTPEIKGDYTVRSRIDGLFTFIPRAANMHGQDKVEGRIGVFIDIVNWKPVMTTDELLLINPNDETDVGFFYERH